MTSQDFMAKWKAEGLLAKEEPNFSFPPSLSQTAQADIREQSNVFSEVQQSLANSPVAQDAIDDSLFEASDVGAQFEHTAGFKRYPVIKHNAWADGFPFYGAQECFGIKNNGDGTVQVYNGMAYRRGDLANNPYTDGVTPQGPLNPGTSVPMGANPWLLWKWDSAGTVITYLAAASIPQDTGTIFYGAIAFFTFSGTGAITGMTRYQCGTILDLTAFAPAT